MVSRYPRVTAKAKKAPGKPSNIPGGVPRPANDNRIGSLVFDTVPKGIIRKINPFDTMIWGMIAAGEAYNDWLYPDQTLVTVGSTVPNPARYTLYQDWNCGRPFDKWTTYSGSYNGCIGVIHTPVVWPDVTDAYTGTYIRRMYIDTDIAQWQLDAGFKRQGADQWWKKIPFVPTTVPAFVTTPGTAIPIPYHPTFPLDFPIARPAVQPAPTIWEAPRPNEEPATRPETKPTVRPAVEAPYVFPPIGVPLVFVSPAPMPVVMPGIIVTTTPTGRAVVTPTNQYAQPYAPPGTSGTQTPDPPKVEHKAQVSTTIGAVWAGLNTYTEVLDFIHAMHDSIPRSTGYGLNERASKAQKIRYMLTNVDAWLHINLELALANYINMQVGDYVAALGSNQIRSLNQQSGHVTGLDRALREHGDMINEQSEDFYNPIPQLDFDPETGEWSITGPWGVLRLAI